MYLIVSFQTGIRGNTWYYRVVCHSDNSIFVHQEIYSMSDWVSIDMGDHLWVYHLVM